MKWCSMNNQHWSFLKSLNYIFRIFYIQMIFLSWTKAIWHFNPSIIKNLNPYKLHWKNSFFSWTIFTKNLIEQSLHWKGFFPFMNCSNMLPQSLFNRKLLRAFFLSWTNAICLFVFFFLLTWHYISYIERTIIFFMNLFNRASTLKCVERKNTNDLF